MKNINRRESPRIDIRLRCHVTSPALWPTDAMHTENISRTGLLLRWAPGPARSALPRLGQIITVEIELPAHHGFDRKCMHLQGSVVRVSDAEGETRVALSVNYIDFRAFAGSLSGIGAVDSTPRGLMA